ncbi:hypothetical protein EK21DRAFT_92444 [Setomelanomma holmii]|uniref:tRNA(Phe) (4-demethylwyosine(37)-C(7)) aminocarboxypropyltransferase n=1 Tax=Setomelanomma holmii TaxID=210430 RepID=A0A9P4LJV2_9PLEO|nr:hypothetical protein EK21DRAFT_92444 [Setomelanomma holmii]
MATHSQKEIPTEILEKRIVLVVSKEHVKTVKLALERAGKLDRTVKITRELVELAGTTYATLFESNAENIMRIPTIIPFPERGGVHDEDDNGVKLESVGGLGIDHLLQDISLSYHTHSIATLTVTEKNLLRRAVKDAFDVIPGRILDTLDLTSSVLANAISEGYSIYKPMLLLPHSSFASSPWQRLLGTFSLDSITLMPVWKRLSRMMGTTHIAINSPIPLQSHEDSSENMLRSPVNLTPIYSDFGPPVTSQTLTNPRSSDFDNALWVTTTQNNIHQTWAPRYTMFSRGNMREKTRLLNSPSVTSLPTPSAALDMYSGIGYFAFSYRRAGLHPIICFELNPWSVEGLRRGAKLNGWSVQVFTNEVLTGQDLDSDADFLVFQMSNEHAVKLQPNVQCKHRIRHVNLGLLPSSRASWKDSAALLDQEEGGWIHVHENVAVADIEQRKSEIEMAFKSYVPEGLEREVKVEWIEKVKMYAPGVAHCVFDVFFGPT